MPLNPLAIDLLYCLAYFVPDNIQVVFLSQIADELPESLKQLVTNRLQLNKTLRLLQRYALIEREGDQITMHRLVQVITQDCLEATSLEITPETIANLLAQISDYLEDQIKYADGQAYAERTLAITEEALGPDHPSTKTVRDNLESLGKARPAKRPTLFNRILSRIFDS